MPDMTAPTREELLNLADGIKDCLDSRGYVILDNSDWRCVMEALRLAAREPAVAEAEPEYLIDDERFNKGVQHVVDMLARELDVSDWVAGDGSEDYDCDLWTTILNIMAAKGIYDPDEGEFATIAHAAPPSGEVERPRKGFAMVPLHPTREMNQVMEEEEWQWEDLLAAADAITEEQYNDIASGSSDEVERLTAENERLREALQLSRKYVERNALKYDIEADADLRAIDAALSDGEVR